MMHDFDIQANLTPAARRLANLVVRFTYDKVGSDADGGGCRAFYSSKEWAERGEEYGLTSTLIVVHDGGDLEYIFGDCFDAMFSEEMHDEFATLGYYAEPCTSWYTAIYPLR